MRYIIFRDCNRDGLIISRHFHRRGGGA